jgi:Avidin family
MSRRSNLLLGLMAGLLWLSAAMPAKAQPYTWTNQYGSVLTVTQIDSNGEMTGTYTNNAAGSCDVGQPQGMTGWYVSGGNGYAISFAVNWQGCNSTTVWTGQVRNDGGFQALWLLSLAAPVAWNGISAGADNFTMTSGDVAKLHAH